jgi:AcrR family transcriptional regulator
MAAAEDTSQRRVSTARERARAEITAELLAAARHQLVEVGAGSLSLRAVAREVGMASSAIYRYFPSRDDLLTRLIIEAYDDVGLVAEQAQANASEQSGAQQFRAVWHSVRRWALEHPHQYSLIFGSPVPGYAAPTDTIAPATRLPEVLLGILTESTTASDSTVALLPPATVASAAAALGPARATMPVASISDAALLAALTSWTTLLGAISFELFGHTHNVVDDSANCRADYFDAQIDLMLLLLGSHHT